MIGVKKLIQYYLPKVDWEKKAKAKAKEEGVSTDDILQQWEDAKEKGIKKGNKLHLLKRDEMKGKDNYIEYSYSKGESEFVYNSGSYKVEEGFTYDERPFVHPTLQLIGIPDRISIVNNKVNIIDFKSDKVMYMSARILKNKGFTLRQKMLEPLGHMDKCNYNEYRLQLSLYMYLILQNNKTLKPGKIEIHHTIFDEDTLEPLHEDIIPIVYLRKEVNSILADAKKKKLC